MVANLTPDGQRHLRDREQPLALCRDADAGRRMAVHDAVRILRAHVHGAVDHEARAVRFVLRFRELVAFRIDLDQRRGGDFLEEQAVGIDEELVFRARDAQREVRGEKVGPAELVGDAKCGGELAAGVPFSRPDAAGRAVRADARDGGFPGGCSHDGPWPLWCGDCTRNDPPGFPCGSAAGR